MAVLARILMARRLMSSDCKISKSSLDDVDRWYLADRGRPAHATS
jgi:hypothetical protein